jgi:hypothetical protein
MMGFKQEQYTGDFVSASNFQAVNGDSLIDNNAIMTDQEEDELESYNNHFGTTDSYPGAQYTTSLSQQQHEQKEEHYDEDADSEMLDGEEDEELLDYDEDSELDEEEVDVDEHEVEEELESFDEEDEDDEDDEEEEEEDGGSEGLAGNEKPGATEDDAIELSD